MFTIDEDQNITIVRGDTAEIEVSVYQTDQDEQPVEYEMQDGDELLFTVKKNTKKQDVLIQKTGTSFLILPEDTESLPYGLYTYDVQFTSATGFVDTIIPPKFFEIAEEVTW